jgi:hypothetical protein
LKVFVYRYKLSAFVFILCAFFLKQFKSWHWHVYTYSSFLSSLYASSIKKHCEQIFQQMFVSALYRK